MSERQGRRFVNAANETKEMFFFLRTCSAPLGVVDNVVVIYRCSSPPPLLDILSLDAHRELFLAQAHCRAVAPRARRRRGRGRVRADGRWHPHTR